MGCFNKEGGTASSSSTMSTSTSKSKTTVAEERALELKRNVVLTTHTEELSSLLASLNTDPATGLTSSAVNSARAKHGANVLTPPPVTPEWIKFLRELTGFFSLLLWGGAALCFVGYALEKAEDNLYLGIVLVFVVLATGIFSYLQNSKSESLMASFKNMLPPKVNVLRDGKTDEIDASQLVPGDIVEVNGGDLIPSDFRVLSCSDNFVVDNSSLTGESEPQQTPINKEIHHFIVIISAIAISLGILFFVMGVVIETPLVSNLVFMIGIIVANVPEGLLATVTVCLTLTAKRMAEKKVLVKNLEGVETLGSTSCICSDKTGTLTQNIMTVAQIALGTDSTFKTLDCPSSFTNGRKTYDSESESFKRLLRCAILCNVATFTESSKWATEDDGTTRKKDDDGNDTPIPFQGMLEQGDGSSVQVVNWKPVGNASECAMIKLAQSECTDPTTLENDIIHTRSSNPTIFVIPFNSKNKYQVHVHDCKQGGLTVEMKGAPERILDRCESILIDGKVVAMTDELRATVAEKQLEMSANGLRCLGFAERELDPKVYGKDYKFVSDDDAHFTGNFPLGEDAGDKTKDATGRKINPKSTVGLVFLGIMALIDPPRPAVPPAVRKCKTAGVKVIMVTGDHPITAQAIAYKVGILWTKTRNDMEADNLKHGRSPGDRLWENPDDALAIVVPGNTISVDTSQESWDFILNHPQIVFARTSPQQKLVIVENCQRQGHIVAVTGDGVNDSPAIKKADIGIAMGIMGSEVTKNAADMILLDDNFASIVNGVEEGRLIFDNLKKSIAYTIQSNIPEITPFLGFIIFAIPLPLTTILILAIDLGTDMIPAISMAYETAEADIMLRPPRNAKLDRLVTAKMINFSYLQIGLMQALGGYLTYMIVLNNYGYPPNILPFVGSLEYWGVQPLYCKFTGGNYVDHNGNIDATLDPTFSPPTREFPLWQEGLNGYVGPCIYPLRDYSGDGFGLPSDFDRTVSTTYGGSTDGEDQPTIESIQQAEQANYFHYVPWKSKLSPFWENRFLWWDVTESNSLTGNLGNTDSSRYFKGHLAGIYSLCANNDGLFGEDGGEAKVRGAKDVFDVDFMPGVSPNLPVSSGGYPAWPPLRVVWSYGNCTSYPPNDPDVEVLGKNSREGNPGSGAIFCNGAEATDGSSDCASVNVDLATGLPNPQQVFYCVDSCGAFGTAECVPPFTNADGRVITGDNVKQCLNIASEKSAGEALAHAQGAYWGAIVIGQIAGLIICKTRWLSVTAQGLTNSFMNFGMYFELVLVAWLAYCDPINVGLGTRNIKLVHWFCAIPFAILIVVYDESRKGLMRATSPETKDYETGQIKRKKGWLELNTYY
ncbi:hypothetical protein ScalyP_jg7148 [Parmales sp. scaly parma]|nr:hypothetical protein ScalyP_jg7148 [Parmales sp. scaly parma]